MLLHFTFCSVWIYNGLVFQFKLRKRSWILTCPINIKALSSWWFLNEVVPLQPTSRKFGNVPGLLKVTCEWGTADTMWVRTRRAKCWAVSGIHIKTLQLPIIQSPSCHRNNAPSYFLKPQDGNKLQENPERSLSG